MSPEHALPVSLSSQDLPSGFHFGSVRAGIKPSGRPDFACALALHGSSAAAVFTGNRVVAAPVVVGREHLMQSGGSVRVVAVNAGNANCATGEPGMEACRAVCAAAAVTFDCPPQQVFPSSTGIIGVQLPADKLIAALPQMAASLGDTAAHLRQFAQAILTTDTRAKLATATFHADGKTVRMVGVAKGAGMIAPRLDVGQAPHATMLAYIFTDAKIAAADLQRLLNQAVEPTFNCISIDGDTSTNDTVLLLASGTSGVEIDGASAREGFAQALRQVCSSLARQIVEDGEGVGHVIELQIDGAATQQAARQVARSIAQSPLVKTAFAGCDPNWGRILAAAGYSGAVFEPGRVSISICGLPVCRNGQIAPDFDRDRVHQAMLARNVAVQIHLGAGQAGCSFLTCDLTAEYVRVNAEYST